MTMPPPDPLAELQEQRDLHDQRHGNLRAGCYPEYCPDARWLLLCDRLAAAGESSEMIVPHAELDTLATLGRVAEERDQALSLVADNNHAWAAKLADSERDRDTATAALANVKEAADDVLAELGKCPDYETAMVAASKLCGTLQFISQHVAALLADSERQRDKAAAQRDRLATDALTARDYWKHVFGTTEGA